MLTLVTVCFNNPDELEKTVASVQWQTAKPDRYVIVDSSDANVQEHMRAIASSAQATYLWIPPTGVYAAMRESMKHVSDGSWVWWVNSSDWLAGKKSVEAVVNVISSDSVGRAHWIVGELLRYKDGSVSRHETGNSGKEFLHLLQSGKTGFPHPSTIFRKSSLAEISPYTDGFSIASDYATALRFGKKFGPPLLLPATLSVHDPSGLTSRHPVKNLTEKSLARLRVAAGSGKVKELWRLPRSVVHGVVTRLVGEKPAENGTSASRLHYLRANEPFESSDGDGINLNIT